MNFRKEHDTMGEVLVPADRLWGAQSQRSFDNFKIGTEKMPTELIEAMAYVKWACACANARLGKLDETRCGLIEDACRAILAGELAVEAAGAAGNIYNETFSHIYLASLQGTVPIYMVFSSLSISAGRAIFSSSVLASPMSQPSRHTPAS